MVKSELINKLSGEFPGLQFHDVEMAVNTVLEEMSTALSSGDRIEIRGFGSFCLHYHPARNAHNPKTGEQVVSIGKHAPHYKPGKRLRERVNQAFLDNTARSDAD